MAHRRSVDIDDDIEATARQRPEELGFQPGTSQARIYSRLMRAGFQALREEQELAQRVKLYQEWAADEQLHRSVQETAEAAFEEGIL